MYTWDYMYLKTKGESGETSKTSGGCTDLGDRPIIVGKDRRARWVTAHVVKRKGDDPYTIKKVGEEVGLAGYACLT